MQELARLIVTSFHGDIPRSREELIKLPGIGEYVAGIFLSSALNRREWIVDTNVVRVLSRFFGLKPRGDGRRDRRIIAIAKKYANCSNPRLANFAIIDFAALVCKSNSPAHSKCYVHSECEYCERCLDRSLSRNKEEYRTMHKIKRQNKEKHL